jgi:hypothetical protein
MIHFEYIVRHTDWCDAAKKIWDTGLLETPKGI